MSQSSRSGGLWLFMQHTKLAAAILAISQDAEAAQYMGIPSDRMYSIVMGLSAGIAAAAQAAANSTSGSGG